MSQFDINNFTREAECVYDGERYSVRDNGAILRHHRIGKRIRTDDNQWTVGKVNLANAYLHLGKARIHRIVATAFHGEPPNPQYVVDHIDTNRLNNRPENLRWVTRLENVLLNPVTRKKIEYLCGSIETFLENPAMLHDLHLEPNFAWMRSVTLEEAQNCKTRMAKWAVSDKKPSGGSLGEWVYAPIKEVSNQNLMSANINTANSRIGERVSHRVFGDGIILQEYYHGNHKGFEIDFGNVGVKGVLASYIDHNPPASSDVRPVIGPLGQLLHQDNLPIRESELVMALTNKCAQYRWRIPSCFPCCPEVIGNDPLESYFQNLKIGAVFSYNDSYPKSTIVEVAKNKNSTSILVMYEKEGMKPWSIAEITYEHDLFIHKNLGSFFEKNGADKMFCIEQGLEWNGGDTFDDFC